MSKEYYRILKTDVLVVGGGTAGLCAAIQAGREGNKVILLEMTNRLGGVMSTCPGMPLGCGYVCCKNAGGLYKEYCDRLLALDPPAAYLRIMPRKDFGWDYYYNQDMAMYMFYEMLEEAHVHTLLNAISGDVRMEGDKISGVEYHDMTGANLIEAKIYIDCSGNGDVAYRAGVPFDMGNGKGEFMTYTMSFVLGNADPQRVIDPADGENGYMDCKDLIAQGVVAPETKNLQFSRMVEPGRFFVNFLRCRGVNGLDPDDMVKRSNEARRQIIKIYQYIRKNVPGFENSYLDGVGPLLGVRDTRRFEGMHRLTEEEVRNGEKFNDSGIVCCDNPIDEVGRGTSTATGALTYIHLGVRNQFYYRVPFGSLVPKKVKNLMFAGKLLSSDIRAQASARGMGTCMIMGQAAGLASGIAISKGIDVQDIVPSEVVKGMQKRGVIGLGEEKLV
jgi:hypothetical protein